MSKKIFIFIIIITLVFLYFLIGAINEYSSYIPVVIIVYVIILALPFILRTKAGRWLAGILLAAFVTFIATKIFGTIEWF